MWKRFRTILQFKKMKNLSRGFFKILQFPIFDVRKKKNSLHKLFVKKLYCEVDTCIINYANLHKISPKETREKWTRVFFVCMFVTSNNLETTTRACVSEAHSRQWCVLNSNNNFGRPVCWHFIVFYRAQLSRRFFKARALARSRNQFARSQKTIGSHFKLKSEFVRTRVPLTPALESS